MSVQKFVQAAANYNSQTFNNTNARMLGVSGVLSGGEVSTAGAVVTVQPIVFVQNGGIVDVSTALTATVPGSLQAPYFVAVSVSSMVENLGETITPTFVKRPEDISPNTVLIAQWDGQEWRTLPKLSNYEIIKASQNHLKYLGLTGIATGFDASVVGSNIVVQPGSATMRDGELVEKFQPASFPLKTAGLSYNRVDRIVLRKAADSIARATTLKYLTGLTFASAGGFAINPATAIGDGQALPSTPRILMSADGLVATFIYIESGYIQIACSFGFAAASVPASLPTANVTDFEAVVNPEGSIDIVYIVNGTDLHYTRTTNTGGVLYTDTVLTTNTLGISSPRIVSVASGAGYFLHIVFTKQISSLRSDIGYMRLSAANTIETAYQTLINLNDLVGYASLDKDDDDSLLYVAYENTSSTRVYLAAFDTGTVTYSSPPTLVGSTVELSDDTYNLSESAQIGVGGAKSVKVVRTSDKNLYVFFLQFKGSGLYGLTCYSPNYLKAFGHKAVMLDYIGVGENIAKYSVVADDLGHAHISTNDGNGVHYSQLLLQTAALSLTTQWISSATSSVGARIALTSQGLLVHAYSDTTIKTGTFKVSAAAMFDDIRTPYLLPTDVLVASYRLADAHLAVQGNYLEENQTVRRLYEYNNLFAGTGSVTWGGSASNKLTVNSPITLRFFSRQSTYTVAATNPNGIVVADNSVVFVQIPDTGGSATLPLQIASFGSGVLDRYNRNIVPLFWAISGVLYTRFAPFRLNADGETIIIGDTLSQQMLTWLGADDTNPDPANHGYASANFISQSDSLNTAIGKLDQNLKSTASSATSGLQAIPISAKAVAVVFATARASAAYRVSVNLENTTDTDVMFQPLTIVAKSVNGFTVAWNAPVDTGNYVLDWILRDN